MTINNTSKSNWIAFLDYEDSEPEIYMPINQIAAVCVVFIKGNSGVEIHTTHNNKNYYFSHVNVDGFMQVDTVNGVAPISTEDLKVKILALL